MGFNGVLKFIVFFPPLLISIDAFYKYDILFRDEEIFSDCNIPNVQSVHEYFDMTNLFFEYQEDGSIYVHGEGEFVKDVGTENNPGEVEVFKKTRGDWVNTIFSIRRPDLCTSMFDSTEFYYFFFKDVKDKSCPFHKGKMFNFNTSKIFSLIMPDPRLEGDYKIQIKVPFPEINKTLCTNILAEVFKVPYLG